MHEKYQISLLELQNKFQNYLLHANDQIKDLVVNTEDVPVELRLDIYANAYRTRLLEALESTYPALKTWLGEDDFYELGHEYMDAIPSSYPSIRWFGDQLPAFIKDHQRYGDYPYVYELAQIEWTMSLVFDEAECPLLNAETVNQLSPESWESLAIQFIPSMHVLSLSWNTFEIWEALTHGREPLVPACSPSPVNWVLWRNELINHYSSVQEDEAFAIAKVMEGATFGSLCEGLCQWMDEENAVIRAATLFKGWIVSGMIKGWTL